MLLAWVSASWDICSYWSARLVDPFWRESALICRSMRPLSSRVRRAIQRASSAAVSWESIRALAVKLWPIWQRY